MRSNPKIFAVAAIAILLAIAVVLIVRPSRHADEPSPPDVATQPAPQAEASQRAHALLVHVVHPADVTSPDQSAAETAAASQWEEKVDEILRDTTETDSDMKANKLLELFPTLPAAGQLETAQHIANLISDTNYFQIASYMTNATTDPDVLDEFFADLLNRPNDVKLPMLLQIARTPEHPEAGEAKDILELYLEEDYGSNWTEWEQHVSQWLKDNPD
jgi:hypothetical protein